MRMELSQGELLILKYNDDDEVCCGFRGCPMVIEPGKGVAVMTTSGKLTILCPEHAPLGHV